MDLVIESWSSDKGKFVKRSNILKSVHRFQLSEKPVKKKKMLHPARKKYKDQLKDSLYQISAQIPFSWSQFNKIIQNLAAFPLQE
ncbi:UNVERIFIED_CONTAM: hypothetical protein NCL1_15677 [Trichonephila clavipes]